MEDQAEGKSTKNFKIIGFACVGIGLLLLVNMVGHLVSFSKIVDYWPGILTVVGLAMAMTSPKQATAGLIMALGGLLAIFTKQGMLSSSLGQLLIAAFVVFVGILLIVKLTRPQ